MSRRHVPVPYEALALCRTHGEIALVVHLYQQGHTRHWKALRETENCLGQRLNVTKREIRHVLEGLESERLMRREIVRSGGRSEGSRLIIFDPNLLDHHADHHADHENNVGASLPTDREPWTGPSMEPSTTNTNHEPEVGDRGEGGEGIQADIVFPLRLIPDRGVEESPATTIPQLSDGTKVALRAAGLAGGKALADLTRKQVLDLHGIGKKRIGEIESWLESHGLKLKDAPLDEARVIARCAEAWTAAWSASQSGKYPWQLQGPDRERCKQWAAALGMPADMDAACTRLAAAIGCYLDAVRAGTAWPTGDPPTTRAFTNDLPKWVIAGDQRAVQPTKTTTTNPFEARRSTEGRFKTRT